MNILLWQFHREYDGSVWEFRDRTGLQAESHYCIDVSSKSKHRGREKRPQPEAAALRVPAWVEGGCEETRAEAAWDQHLLTGVRLCEKQEGSPEVSHVKQSLEAPYKTSSCSDLMSPPAQSSISGIPSGIGVCVFSCYRNVNSHRML